MKYNIFIQVNKSNLRPRQMKVNTVTRLRQDIKHLRHWNKSESRSCRQDRVKNESDSDTFESTSQSKHHWEWDESDPELAYTAETGPSQMTCKTETRVKAARRLKQVKVKTPKTPSHVRNENTHEGWDKSELVSQNQMITALHQFWTKYWL